MIKVEEKNKGLRLPLSMKNVNPRESQGKTRKSRNHEVKATLLVKGLDLGRQT